MLLRSVTFQTTLFSWPGISTLFPRKILEFRFTRDRAVFWSTPLPLKRRQPRYCFWFAPSYLRGRAGALFIQGSHTASMSFSDFTLNSITLNTCRNSLVYTNDIFPSVRNPNSTDSIFTDSTFPLIISSSLLCLTSPLRGQGTSDIYHKRSSNQMAFSTRSHARKPRNLDLVRPGQRAHYTGPRRLTSKQNCQKRSWEGAPTYRFRSS